MNRSLRIMKNRHILSELGLPVDRQTLNCVVRIELTHSTLAVVVHYLIEVAFATCSGDVFVIFLNTQSEKLKVRDLLFKVNNQTSKRRGVQNTKCFDIIMFFETLLPILILPILIVVLLRKANNICIMLSMICGFP